MMVLDIEVWHTPSEPPGTHLRIGVEAKTMAGNTAFHEELPTGKDLKVSHVRDAVQYRLVSDNKLTDNTKIAFTRGGGDTHLHPNKVLARGTLKQKKEKKTKAAPACFMQRQCHVIVI